MTSSLDRPKQLVKMLPAAAVEVDEVECVQRVRSIPRKKAGGKVAVRGRDRMATHQADSRGSFRMPHRFVLPLEGLIGEWVCTEAGRMDRGIVENEERIHTIRYER
jgi:hypothetical protein